MLSFATEFPVKDTDADSFVDAVKAWVLGSPHTKFSPEQMDELTSHGRSKVQAQAQQLESIIVKNDNDQIAAFRHVVEDGFIEWVTEVIYSKNSAGDWVSVETSRESSRPILDLPLAKKPLIVRTLIDQLGGGLDDELYVLDTPHFFRECDARMAIRLLNADAENYLPLVYVSCPFDGRITVNPMPLARTLGGLAHVVVEPNRAFSRAIQAEVGSRNAYGGAVGVYWPSGEQMRYFVDTAPEYEIRQTIVSDIRRSLINRRPLAYCTWTRAEAELARSVLDTLKNSGSDDVSQYVTAFDSEIAAKNKQIEAAESEISRLADKLRTRDVKSTKYTIGINFEGEQQYSVGEFSEILFDALSSAINNAQDDGRRQHVLRAAVASFGSVAGLALKRDLLKELLKNYRNMDGDTKDGLEKLGFSVTEEGKHFKLIYMNDDRYTFTLAKSGSDWRGGLNAVSDISKRLF